jgi:hypothetical protein
MLENVCAHESPCSRYEDSSTGDAKRPECLTHPRS